MLRRGLCSLSLILLLLSDIAGAAARSPAFGQRGMVVTPVWPASEAGLEIFKRGGNAIDVAVAAAFAVGVCEPYASGIGGGGFVLIRLGHSGEVFAIDAREVAPAAAHRDMYLDASGRVNRDASRTGGLAVAVPGLVRGLVEAHGRFGRLPLDVVLAPAVQLARAGFPTGVRHRRVLEFAMRYRRFERFPETARIQLDRGELPPLGWRLRQRDLAASLEAIADGGADAFYTGPMAEAIAKAAQLEGGTLTTEDLASYETRWSEPVRGTYRGLEVVSFPPPSSGGVHLIQMLNTLEPFHLAATRANSRDTIHLVAESMKLAFADRAAHLGDPAFYPVPVDWLTSKAYGRELADRIAPRPFWRKAPWNWGRRPPLRVESASAPPPDDSGTSHLSVMDAEGNAVSITQTVNLLFGSGITVPGTGIVLNNEMDDFSSAPNTPNAFGLTGQRANEIQPGKRPLSSMTPTIILDRGEPWMVIGSPGGPRIITTVLLVVLNVVDFGMDIQQAVGAPRFHHQWRPDRLYLEPDYSPDLERRLEDWGHPVFRSDRPWSSGQGIVRDPETGTFWGGSDPRADGRAVGY
jgi:gamma-glutamyltranspeptidase/glutathione hydrolase